MTLVQPIRLKILPRVPPINGQSVDLQATATHLQWRYAATDTQAASAWTNLVALSEITGPEGPNIELRVDGGFIQWRVEGDVSWTNLIALSELTGPPGSPGAAVVDRVALAALDTDIGAAFLMESGRQGNFIWGSGNYSGQVTADPDQYFYVAPAGDATGASGAWLRVEPYRQTVEWVHVIKKLSVLNDEDDPYPAFAQFGPTADSAYIDHAEVAVHGATQAYLVIGANVSGVQWWAGANAAGAGCGANTDNPFFMQWGDNTGLTPFVQTYLWGARGGNLALGDPASQSPPQKLTIGTPESTATGAAAQIGVYDLDDVRIMARTRTSNMEAAFGVIEGFSGGFVGSVSASRFNLIYNGAQAIYLASGVFNPHIDNSIDLGDATHQWQDIFLVNAPTVSSDARGKLDVEDSPLGLDFIRKLRPVSYRLKEGKTEAVAVKKTVTEQARRTVEHDETVYDVVDGEAVPSIVKKQVEELVFDHVPVFGDVEETVLEEKEIEVIRKEVRDGQMHLSKETLRQMRPVMDRIQVMAEGRPVFENGEPVYVSVPRKRTVRKQVGTHKVPVMVEVEKDVVEHVPVEGKRRHFGLLSQEVKEALGDTDFAGWVLSDPTDPESAQKLRYEEFIPVLIAALKEQQAQIEALSEQVRKKKLPREAA